MIFHSAQQAAILVLLRTAPAGRKTRAKVRQHRITLRILLENCRTYIIKLCQVLVLHITIYILNILTVLHIIPWLHNNNVENPSWIMVTNVEWILKLKIK